MQSTQMQRTECTEQLVGQTLTLRTAPLIGGCREANGDRSRLADSIEKGRRCEIRDVVGELKVTFSCYPSGMEHALRDSVHQKGGCCYSACHCCRTLSFLSAEFQQRLGVDKE